MWSNKEADFFPEINKSFTFPGMGLQLYNALTMLIAVSRVDYKNFSGLILIISN